MTNGTQTGNLTRVIYLTDPFCCWSWAFQPQLEKLKAALGRQTLWELRMGGLIPSWNNYHDEVNAVSRPAQLGPVWMHAGQLAGAPIHHQVWMKDPPESSYPACIAVKCAQLQRPEFGEPFLLLLQQALMTEGRNIAKVPELFNAAKKFEAATPAFDTGRFKNDFYNGPGLEAFNADLEFTQRNRISRFPSLVVIKNKKGMVIPGYRPCEEILEIIKTQYSNEQPA